MPHIYFIADTHFGHENIIKYCHRPFNDITEMNDTLIANWNRVVSENDIVYHLGDLAISPNLIPDLLTKLNGNIYLLRGNHDGKSINYYHNLGIRVIPNKLILPEYSFMLSHRPIPDNLMAPNIVNIFGHIHDKPLDDAYDDAKHYCVSVEKIDYTPISVNKLLKRVRKKP